MGRLSADDMARQPVSLEAQLAWHLQSNHFPPVHPIFIPVAIAAIEAANEGDWDRVIDFPEGSVKESGTVAATVEGLHLESFVDFSESEGF